MNHSGKWVFAALLAVVLMVGVVKAEELSPNAAALAPGLFSGVTTPKGRNSLTGELYADIMGTTVAAQRVFKNALPSIADYSQSAHMVSNSYCAPTSNWVMWDTPFLTRDVRDRNDGYLGYKQTTSGFATGLSRMLGETTAVGLAVGYDARKLTGQDDYHWRNKADAFHAALYGGTALGCFFIDGYAGYSRAWQRAERTVYDGATPPTLHGNYNDTVLSAGLKASYVWILPNEMRVTPSIGLDLSHVRSGAFTETGSATYALGVNKANHTSLQTPVMVSVNKTFSANFLTFAGVQSMWTPEVRVGYIPQFGSKRAGVDYTFLTNGQTYKASSTKFGGSYGVAGAGLKIKLKDKFIFAVDYDYTFGGKYDNHTVTGTYGVSF